MEIGLNLMTQSCTGRSETGYGLELKLTLAFHLPDDPKATARQH